MSRGQPARGDSSPAWRSVVGALLVGALAPACADEPPPPVVTPAAAVTPAAPAPAKPLPPLPRSSIVAVVQHRGELGLSDEQIEAMEKRDREREEEDAALRAEVEKKKKAAEDAAKNAGNAAAPNRTPGGMRGGGMGAGMPGGGMRGGGMGGGRGGHSFGAGAAKPGGESLEDRLDANDTKAYLDIEDVLTPAQRDAAREIASDYRAQLYDRREQQRTQAAPK